MSMRKTLESGTKFYAFNHKALFTWKIYLRLCISSNDSSPNVGSQDFAKKRHIMFKLPPSRQLSHLLLLWSKVNPTRVLHL